MAVEVEVEMEMEMVALPIEIILEIIAKLPVKSIGRCRCLSKTLNSLIAEPLFIRKQLLRSHESTDDETDNHLILNRNLYYDSIVYRLNSNNIVSEEGFQIPYGCTFYLVGLCNGLVCLISNSWILLWNPTTRKEEKIENPGLFPSNNSEEIFPILGFVFEPHSCDYNVVAIHTYRSNDCAMVKIYSRETNCWRKRDYLHFPYHWFYHILPPLVKGRLHWIVDKMVGGNLYEVVLCFNVLEEVFHDMPLPDDYGRKLKIDRFCDSISCFAENWDNGSMNIWVMKDYGVADSWTKLFTLEGNLGRPLAIMGDGETLLLHKRNKDVVLYHYTTKNQRKLIDGGLGYLVGAFFCLACKRSLALLKEENLSAKSHIFKIPFDYQILRRLMLTCLVAALLITLWIQFLK